MNQPQATPFSSLPHAQDPVELRLLLICHAEEMQNRYVSLAGADSGLTAIGWRQTDLLAEWLATHYKIDRLLAAPQLRNRLTAQRVGQTLGLPVTVHQRLSIEQELASAVGDPTAGGQDAGMDDHLAVDDGHLHDGARHRVQIKSIMDQIRKEYRGSTVALFMDGGLIATTLATIVGATNFHALLSHTSVTELQLRGDQWFLACMNRHEHLPEPENPEIAQQRQTQDVPVIKEDLALFATVYGPNVAACVEVENEERQKWLDDLVEFANLKPEMQVLDVGTGAGLLALTLADTVHAYVVGIDISPAMLERAEYFRLNSSPDIAKRVDFRLAAAQRLPFRQERFDAVICRMVLHLNRQPLRLLQEAWRVLKPDGVLIVADLLSAEDPVRRATQNAIEERRNPTHISAHSKAQYAQFVKEAGFRIESEKVAVFVRRLGEWMAELAAQPADGAVVHEMVEASLETDAAGINAKRQGDEILFDQRLIYIRAEKSGSNPQ